MSMRKVIGMNRSDTIEPRILSALDAMRYHANFAWAFAKEGDVVMYTEGATWVGGHEAGEHDSIRDGYSSGRRDTRNNRVVYVPLADWLAAGYPMPK